MNNLIKRSVLIKNWEKLVKPSSVLVISSHGKHKNQDKQDQTSFGKKTANLLLLGLGGCVAGFAYYNYEAKVSKTIETFLVSNPQAIPVISKQSKYGRWKEGLPVYTTEDVAKHGEGSTRMWVIFKEGVYDITDFIPKHPGRENIMLGVGASVEPFWITYGIHYKEEILEMLEEYRIGNIPREESRKQMEGVADPFENEPTRNPLLKPASIKPFNAEPDPAKLLVKSFYTPNELFYIRNHLPVPHIDAATYELAIEIEGSKDVEVRKSLSLDDIKKLPKHEVDAAVMCAGNRRSDMTKVAHVKGLNWGYAAIGNAKWGGAKLRDVLISAGVQEDDPRFKHVHFHGADTDPAYNPYNVSIPIHKAMDKYGDVILAYEMNGEPLPLDHGFPVRVIVPGTAGARNTKWLTAIVVSPNESEGFWQQKDYKGFSPSDTWETADFSKAQSIQGLPVISAICTPEAEDCLVSKDGYITTKGYAYSGGGNKIIRVDVSANGGKTWTTAELEQNKDEPPRHYSWTLWTAKVPIDATTEDNKTELWVKAVDSNYNTQPESFENIWNIRGVLNNAYHRVPIYVEVKETKKN